MNSVENLRAKKWLAEQQALAQQQIDDVDSLYDTDVVEEEPFDCQSSLQEKQSQRLLWLWEDHADNKMKQVGDVEE